MTCAKNRFDEPFCERLQLRSRGFAATRDWFSQEDFWEVDTPMLAPTAVPDPHIDPITAPVRLQHCNKSIPHFLHTSPEVFLKRACSKGAQRVYQLGHVFRNGETSRLHAVEFTLLEWYRVGARMQDVIHDCQGLFAHLALQLRGTTHITLPAGGACDLGQPFTCMTMQEAWKRYAQLDLRAYLVRMQQGEPNALVHAVQAAGHTLRPNASWDDAFHHVMLTCIEPGIGQKRPCALTHWPAQLACLARLCPKDPVWAERFEIYAGGMELTNGFTELTDDHQQRQRFATDNRARQQLGKAPLPVSEGFLDDLQHLPGCAGVAVGFDRLLLLLTSGKHLQHVLPFAELPA